MCQFMGQEPAAFARPRGKSVGREEYMVADGIGKRIDGLRRFCGPPIGVNADPAEVVSEARLEEGPGSTVERLAGRAQGFVDNGRSHVGGGLQRWSALESGFLLLARLAFSTARSASAASALALQHHGPHWGGGW
jgi:hypothetical protein